MEKLFKYFTLIILLIATACGGKPKGNSWFQADGKIRILATTAMIGDLVREIGGHSAAT